MIGLVATKPIPTAWLQARAAGQRAAGDWYRIKNLGTGAASIHIYDEIGYYGITASDFVAELSAMDAGSIDLHINSPGGEVFDGIAIMNALKAHKAKVTCYVDSLAASIASVIAMAGDKIVMAPHSEMMIHDASGVGFGNADEMREYADMLDRQSDKIAGIYAERAGGTTLQWRNRMKAETWLSAKEAVEIGLADEIDTPATAPDEELPAAAKFDLAMFNYAGRSAAPAPDIAAVVPNPPVDVEAPAGWDPEAFKAAANACVPQEPTFDAEQFRAVMAHAANNVPAPADPAPPVPPAAEPVFTIDRSAFRRALWEAQL